MCINRLVIESKSDNCDKEIPGYYLQMDSCAIATTTISVAPAFRLAHTIINLIFTPPKSNHIALHTDWLLPRKMYFLNMPIQSFLNLCLSCTDYLRNNRYSTFCTPAKHMNSKFQPIFIYLFRHPAVIPD